MTDMNVIPYIRWPRDKGRREAWVDAAGKPQVGRWLKAMSWRRLDEMAEALHEEWRGEGRRSPEGRYVPRLVDGDAWDALAARVERSGVHSWREYQAEHRREGGR